MAQMRHSAPSKSRRAGFRVVGIVHQNGILMLDSEQHFRGQDVNLRDAIFQAGRRRLRPILMNLAIGVGSVLNCFSPSRLP